MLPDHRQLYFNLTGPLTIRDRVRLRMGVPIESNYTAECHHCGWATYDRDVAKIRQLLLNHIWRAHQNAPDPISNQRLHPPGR